MRFSITLLLAFTGLLHVFTSAQHLSRPKKRDREQNYKPTPAIQSRQLHVKKDLIDLCLSTNALAIVGLPGLLNPLLAGLNLCLCIHDLDIFLQSNVGVLLANLLGGKNNLLARLDLLIHTSSNTHECRYPTHSSPHCTAHNPCGYTCNAPYVPSISNGHPACVCPPPFVECNGQCSRKRAPQTITTLEEAKKTCQSHQTVCGVPGHDSAFECLDTSTSVDSCGGCTTHNPFTKSASGPLGVDCSRLPGVDTTSCVDSRCRVIQCRDGWTVSPDSASCVRLPGLGTRMMKLRRNELLPSKLSTVIGTDLSSQIEGLLPLVNDLRSCPIAPTPPSSPSPPDVSLGLIDGSLINSVVGAVGNVIISADVDTLIENVDELVQANALLSDAVDGCQCTSILSLGPLIGSLGALVNAAVDIQVGLGHLHPTASAHPTSSLHTSTRPHHTSHHTTQPTLTGTHVHPTGSHVPGHLGLDGILPGLGIGLGTTATAALNTGLESGSGLVTNVGMILDANAHAYLDGIVEAAIGLYSHSLSLEDSLSAPSEITLPIQASLSATVDAIMALLDSSNYAGLLANLESLLEATNLAMGAIDGCGCASEFGLQPIVSSLSNLVNKVLSLQSWCRKHQSMDPRSLPPTVNPDDEIVIGLDDFFSVLNLKAVKARVGLKGLGPPHLSSTINNYLNVLHIGPASSHVGRRVDGSPIRSKVNRNAHVNPTLVTDVRALAYLVVNLGHACESSNLPHIPQNLPSQGSTPTSPADIGLIVPIIIETNDLINANTVGSLLAAIDALVNVSTAAQAALNGCGCIETLGLGGLVAELEGVLNAALGLQAWIALNPVIIEVGPHTPHGPSHPHASHTSYLHTHSSTSTRTIAVTSTTTIPPSPSASTGPPSGPQTNDPNLILDLTIDLGLGGSLGDLLASVVASLGVVLNGDAVAQLGGLVNGLVDLVLGITTNAGAGTALPVPSASLTAFISASASATVLPTHDVPVISNPVPPGLVEQILGLTGQLVSATNIGSITTSATALLDLNGVLSSSLLGCGCVDGLGLGGLVNDVEALTVQLVAILGWCEENGPTVNAGSEPIVLNASDLLNSLGLGDLIQVSGVVDGLGAGVSHPVNSILHLLGLGGRKLRR